MKLNTASWLPSHPLPSVLLHLRGTLELATLSSCDHTSLLTTQTTTTTLPAGSFSSVVHDMAPNTIVSPTRTGFLDLPAEIRIDIYREALKSTKPICCGRRTSRSYPYPEPQTLGQLSSQFLLSCKTVYAEARPILFEVNTFELQRATDLKLLKKLAGTCSRRIQALSYRSSTLVINMTRLRELKSLPCLKAVTISSGRDYPRVSPSDPVDPIARSCRSYMNQHHTYLRELMRSRADVRFDIVSWGLSSVITASGHIVDAHFDIKLGEDGVTPTLVFTRFLD